MPHPVRETTNDRAHRGKEAFHEKRRGQQRRREERMRTAAATPGKDEGRYIGGENKRHGGQLAVTIL